MVYAYLRVSTEMQDENSQRLGVDDFAKRNNLLIDKYIIDFGISGAKDFLQRNIGKMIKDLKKGDTVLISEISRIGRRLILVLDFVNICIKKGVNLYSVKDGYKIDDSLQSKVMLTVMGLCAEIERDLIRQRTKEGLARVRANGTILGRPHGRRSDLCALKLYEKKDRFIALHKKGYTQRKIAKMLKVNRNTISRFLKRLKEENEI